ncbi:MAG: SDR family oxidoreductase [Rhodospirillales bacterium]|nr:SDR family oxidoreductase [Rhodospirillales bacterium]
MAKAGDFTNWGFKGRLAVVTGAMRGIGRAIALALQEAGAEVHAFDWDISESDTVPFQAHKVNVADAASVAAAAKALPRPAELLVNNAGITRDRTLVRMSGEEWQQVLDVNLTGAFNTMRILAPGMTEAGYGRIVNISSINGLRGKFGQTNYSASKAGLIGLSKAAARELGPKGVTVNVVAPGLVLTEMALQMPPEVLEKSKADMQIKTVSETSDIANAVLFFLSEPARTITGQVLKVDGGAYM